MNPLTQFKKIPIVPLLALALVTLRLRRRHARGTR